MATNFETTVRYNCVSVKHIGEASIYKMGFGSQSLHITFVTEELRDDAMAQKFVIRNSLFYGENSSLNAAIKQKII